MMGPSPKARTAPGSPFAPLAGAVALLLLLPLAGAALAGRPLLPYLELPPRTPDIPHAPFSLPVFLGFSLLILAATGPFIRRLAAHRGEPGHRGRPHPFPWWGWAGVAAMGVSWLLAWARFPWMGALQAHTFTPLWLSLIVVLNAYTCRRSGRCPLLSRPRGFLLLFPASAAFWWSFEYLNRFVGNWQYVGGGEFGPGEYFLFATLPFATVLPAVLSMRDLLRTFPRVDGAFRDWRPYSPAPPHLELRADGVPPIDVAKGAIRAPRRRGTPAAGRTGGTRPRAIALAALLLACAGLLAVGVVPDAVFPLVWVAPPAILVSLSALRGVPHALSGIASGDWRPFAASSLAALACGFFWEMWNFHSLAKWVYLIPYVDAFRVFEMPVLGYAGYLPFGVLCAEIGDRVLERFPEKKSSSLRRQL